MRVAWREQAPEKVRKAREDAQMESRAEAARTSARLAQIEEGLRALLETPEGGCGEGEETRAG
jgi:plasmid stabilization system protein ParE